MSRCSVRILWFALLLFFIAANAVPMKAATPAASVTTLSVSSSSVMLGTTVSLNAYASSAAAPITAGTITFYDGSTALATIELISSGANRGHALYQTRLGIGSHSLSAAFRQTLSYAASSAPAQNVSVTGKLPTATAISSSGASPYTLTATVTSGALPAPSSDVSFLDQSNGNAVLGSAVLAGAAHGFAPHVDYSSQPQGHNLAIADLNADGIPDIAVAGENGLSVHLGKGDGTFQPQTTYSDDGGSFAVVAADLNGDGKPDLAVADFGASTLTIFLGNGNGTFQTQTTYPTGNQPFDLVVADFNGDGILDVATSNNFDNTASVLLGNGDGSFQPEVAYSAGNAPALLTVGDFNGDGALDLAIPDLGDNAVSILLGNGDGTFQTATEYATGTLPWGVAAADLNADGHLDLVVSSIDDGTVNVLLGNGDGTFQPQTAYSAVLGARGVAIGDFNGDGLLDILAGSNDLPAAISGPPFPQPTGTFSLLLGNGNGTFQAQTTYPTGDDGEALAVADLNGDGSLDAISVNGTDGSVAVLLNQVTATASVSNLSVAGGGTHQVLASYGGDSSHSASSSTAIALQGSQVKTSLTLVANPNPSTYGQQVVLTATLSPNTSGSLTTSGEAVTFKSGTTVLGTALLNSSGVAAFPVTSLPAGSDSLTAVYAGDTNFLGATSNLVTQTVNSATSVTLQVAATRLVYPLPPAFEVTIAPNGKIAPTGSVEILDGSTKIGTYPLPKFTDGHTFGLVLSPLNVGQHPLSAVYSGDKNYAPGTSATVTVTITPGPVALRVSCTDLTLKAGQTLKCTAAVDEVLLPASGSIGFALNNGPSTTASLQNGVATLDISSPPAGKDTLTVTYAAQGNYQAAQPVSVHFTVTAH